MDRWMDKVISLYPPTLCLQKLLSQATALLNTSLIRVTKRTHLFSKPPWGSIRQNAVLISWDSPRLKNEKSQTFKTNLLVGPLLFALKKKVFEKSVEHIGMVALWNLSMSKPWYSKPNFVYVPRKSPQDYFSEITWLKNISCLQPLLIKVSCTF